MMDAIFPGDSLATHRSTFVGIAAALGISLSASVGMPLVGVFGELLSGELMIVRGAVTIVLVSVIIAVRIVRTWRQNRNAKEEDRLPLAPLFMPSWWMIGFSVLFSTATVPFYEAIQVWGAGPTVVVLTGTPIVNITAKLFWHKQTVASRVFACLGALAFGVAIAENPWAQGFSTKGFLLSVLATILVGIAFEVLSSRKSVDPYCKSLWLGVVTIGIGLVATVWHGSLPFTGEIMWTSSRIALLLTFGLTGGFLYYLCNILAFEHLKTEVASMLAMAETPAVLIGAWVINGKELNGMQCLGVTIALTATLAFGRAESKVPAEQPSVERASA